ncbi:hypothetical protein Leryth_005481 [Lithospermum erythrorhizon]|uniref:LOB domain-containing protein n=1 Tax=Lithospermum erythrorhizon TaxID=34254 RepID=A0AAV3QQA9_LITER|nr:hypothetical protein Leryth_005481 [Lithospermum erythrorhizon]
MTGTGSPCGACKFLRRKCVRGCVFAPYFCHEQGASHFSAIHKVFGASNVSKLLAHLPLSDRSEAATTIAYEAQARLQDPIYGCVSHIFSLQQQVVSLQAQLARLKEQAAGQTYLSGANYSTNPRVEKPYEKTIHYPQDVQNWINSSTQDNCSSQVPQFDHYNSSTYYGAGNMNHYNNNQLGNNNYGNSSCFIPEENNLSSFSSYEEGSGSMDSLDMTTNERQWGVQKDMDNNLHTMALRYFQHS